MTDSLYQYPDEAEAFWISEAEKCVSCQGPDALSELTEAVTTLSNLFTTQRPYNVFPDYFTDPKLIAAYGIFFLPQSYIRTIFALAQIFELRGWRSSQENLNILDFGSGPGSCGVAITYYLKQIGYNRTHLVGMDKSTMALNAMVGFSKAVLGPKVQVSCQLGDISKSNTWPKDLFDIIVVGFVLNEIPQLDDASLLRWFDSLRGMLRPGGLVLILEPALRFTSERLKRLSDTVAASVLPRIAPELDAFPDPQLKSSSHWTYESRIWKIPSSTEYVNRRLHRNLREVRFSFAAFSDAKLMQLPKGLARIISDIQVIKGLLRFFVMREGKIQTVEITTRGLSKHEIKQLLSNFERGDVINHPTLESLQIQRINHSELKVFWGLRSTNVQKNNIHEIVS